MRLFPLVEWFCGSLAHVAYGPVWLAPVRGPSVFLDRSAAPIVEIGPCVNWRYANGVAFRAWWGSVPTPANALVGEPLQARICPYLTAHGLVAHALGSRPLFASVSSRLGLFPASPVALRVTAPRPRSERQGVRVSKSWRPAERVEHTPPAAISPRRCEQNGGGWSSRLAPRLAELCRLNPSTSSQSPRTH